MASRVADEGQMLGLDPVTEHETPSIITEVGVNSHPMVLMTAKRDTD